MRFTQTLFAGAALVASVLAVKPEINEFPASVEAGRTYKVTYSPGGSIPTTFILRKGKNEALDTVGTLTTSATGGEFSWSVSSDLENAEDYALEIRQAGEEPNYIGPIALSGGEDAKPSSSSSASATTSAASSSSTGSVATITTMTSATISGAPSSSGNGTVSVSISRTASPTETETQGAPAEATGAASALGSSPLALVFGAAAAMLYLN